MASLIHSTAHGLVAGDTFKFANLIPANAGPDEATLYYVLAAGLTADAFEFSESAGGTAFVLTYAITEGSVIHSDTYVLVDSTEMPTLPTLDPPTALTLSSTVAIDADGHQQVEVKAAFTVSATPGVIGTKVELATTASGPDWTTAKVLRAPLGTAFVRFVVPGNIGYSVRAASEDVYGRLSSYTAVGAHTATMDTTAPATPTGLSAAAGILSISASWTANTELDLAHYLVEYSSDSGFSGSTTVRLKGTKITLAPLAAGTWYVRVKAVDTSGNASANTASQNAAARTVTAADITAGTITVTEIADNSISTPKLQANAVTAAKIAADTITANEIAANAITSVELAANAVIAGKIAALTIVAADIAAATITGAKIAAGTITASNIQADTLTANEIAASAISTSELAANAVTAAKMAAGSINVGMMQGSPSNLVPNPSLEFDTANNPPSGWGVQTGSVYVGTAGTGYTTDPAIGHSGIKSLLHTQPNPVISSSRDTWAFPVIAGRRYKWSFWMRGAAANGATANGRMNVLFIDAAGATLSNTSVKNTASIPGTSTTFTQYSGTITADALAVYAVMRPNVSTTAAAVGDKIYFDDFEFYPADYDVDHAAGNVLIDSTGITINNGKIVLKDEFAASSLLASGFSGNWRDFIATGLYNGAFRSGVAGSVGLGRTSALPYWTVADVNSGGTLTFLNPGVKFTWGATSDEKSITADRIPVLPGQTYEISVAYDVTRSAGTIDFDLGVTYWDSTEVFSTGLILLSVSHSASQTFITKKTRWTAGSTTYFADFYISARELTSHNASNKLDVWSLKATPVPGNDPDVTFYTTSGSPHTWTKPANLKYIEVWTTGGGGAGGGAASTSSTQSSAGGGGGGGGTSYGLYLAELLPDSLTATTGAGGTVGSAGNNPGNNGGNTTFAAGTTYGDQVGSGGAGGDGSAATTGPGRNAGGLGGSASGGDLNVIGSDGSNGVIVRGDVGQGDVGQLGDGGASGMAYGGATRGPAASGAGSAGSLYGGGGGGGFNANSQGTNRTGGAGGAGAIIIKHYYV